jgi:hypothetical protein
MNTVFAVVGFASGYLWIGCGLAAWAKHRPPESLWYILGPTLIPFWPVLVPLALLAGATGWLYDKL